MAVNWQVNEPIKLSLYSWAWAIKPRRVFNGRQYDVLGARHNGIEAVAVIMEQQKNLLKHSQKQWLIWTFGLYWRTGSTKESFLKSFNL